MQYLDKLVTERTSLTSVMNSIRDQAAAEDRDLTEAQRSEITRLQERCVELDAQLTEHQAQHESAMAFAALSAKIEETRPANGTAAGGVLASRAPAQLESTGPGEAFVESEQFRSYAGRGNSGRVSIPGYLPLDTRAVITTASLAIQPYVLAPQEIVSRAPLLDVLNHVQVSSGVVEWVEVGGDPTAAVVAEGAAKPEATLTFTPASSALDTIAHWVQITRQALEDAPYIRSLVEGKLRRGLLAKIEADAAAQLTASTAIQTAGATAAAGGMSAAIRIGIGKVESAGYNPNAIVLNPADYAALDIQAAADSNAGPTRRTQFWGLTTIADSAVTAGNAYVGDFQSGMTLFDRGVSDVFVSDSHADLFIKNILVILAESRVKTAITDPLALCECTVSP